MESFDKYISFWKVADVIISKRVQLCEKRHKKHQMHLLSHSLGLGNMSESERQIMSIMPPRRSWVSLAQRQRYKDLGDGNRQKKAVADCNRQCIKRTVKRDLKAEVEPLYLGRLKEFVEKIRCRVLEVDFALSTPELFPEEKDEKSCRPLSKFVNLEDAVIVILANRYLTELFNDFFYEDSLAFRSKREYHGEKDYVTAHHDAIAMIKEYRNRFEGRRLYVSECDLQKFYDTVSHKVVRKCYYDLIKKATKENPDIRFDEINRVFEAYLGCYSFPKNVFCKNGDEIFWKETKIKESARCFKWVDEELINQGVAKSMGGLMRMRIGVPQGGALSGLIANIVLNTVDWQVKGQMTGNDLYLRYCDDMIIFSTCKKRCKDLFSVYYNGTKRLNLVPHKPEKELKYGVADFWAGKSKKVYLWEMGMPAAAEWIGFVGYEIRRDGLLRVRKKSFRKELNKQMREVFEKTIDKIKNKERVCDESLLSTLENKLISISVGKISVWNASFIESEMCWSAGFKELEMNPVLERQLRTLDRHRRMILGAARRRLKSCIRIDEEVKRKDLNIKEDKNSDKNGIVHSYYYQFARAKK